MSGRIVVGIDESKGSRRALHWAVAEAAMRNATLVVVHAWEYPAARHGVPASLDAAGRQLIALTLKEVGTDGVKLLPLVREGRAASVLVSEAQGADLLVVGSRGRGGVAAALLGSVSRECLHYARCPVVVVRPSGRRPRIAPDREAAPSTPDGPNAPIVAVDG